jgi:membrane protein
MAEADLNPPDRGRAATTPTDISAGGWWDITWRVFKRLGSDNVTLVSGGVAMYVLLSVFPGLTALVSFYGMFATPADVVENLKGFAGVLPPGVWDIFNAQLTELVRHSSSSLSVAAAISIAIALWSARSAMSALMTATNIAYGEREKRSFIKQVLVSLAFTLGAIFGFIIMLILGVGIPVALNLLGSGDTLQIAATVLRLVLLWALTIVGLSFIYRFAPAREYARWRWVTWGSVFAATLWLAASALFAFYVQRFGSYGKTYGALGSVIVLLMWFYISSIIVVLGAELNAEMERQTRQDTTVRGGAPIGKRGAYAADTIGPRAGQGDPQPAVGKNEIAGS